MSVIAIINVIIVNVVIVVGLSYFWSFWTHKLFKPWAWLELRKRKLISSRVDRIERKYKDRVRFYSCFFAMQHIEQHEVEGGILFLGLEETGLLELLRNQCPQRKIVAVGTMEARSVTLTRENCQGEISEQTVAVDYANESDVRRVLPDGGNSTVIKGSIVEALPTVEGPLALCLIDSVDYDDVCRGLQHAYGLMSGGGIIIVHGYNHNWQSIREAVDYFCSTVPEGFFPLPDMYGSVALVRNSR